MLLPERSTQPAKRDNARASAREHARARERESARQRGSERGSHTSSSVSLIFAFRYSVCSASPEPTFRRLFDAILPSLSLWGAQVCVSVGGVLRCVVCGVGCVCCSGVVCGVVCSGVWWCGVLRRVVVWCAGVWLLATAGLSYLMLRCHRRHCWEGTAAIWPLWCAALRNSREFQYKQ